MPIQQQQALTKDELVFDRVGSFSLRTKHELLKKEALDLESRVRQATEGLDSLVRLQQR